jgi:hypothetical protein
VPSTTGILFQPAGYQGSGGLQPAAGSAGGHGELTLAPILHNSRLGLQAWIQSRYLIYAAFKPPKAGVD